MLLYTLLTMCDHYLQTYILNIERFTNWYTWCTLSRRPNFCFFFKEKIPLNASEIWLDYFSRSYYQATCSWKFLNTHITFAKPKSFIICLFYLNSFSSCLGHAVSYTTHRSSYKTKQNIESSHGKRHGASLCSIHIVCRPKPVRDIFL